MTDLPGVPFAVTVGTSVYLLVPMSTTEMIDLECWADEHQRRLGDLAAQVLRDEAHR